MIYYIFLNTIQKNKIKYDKKKNVLYMNIDYTFFSNRTSTTEYHFESGSLEPFSMWC